MKTIRVLIVEGAPLARSHITRLLKRRSGFEVVGQVGTAIAATEAMARLTPDLVFLDTELPDIRELRPANDTRVAFVLTTSSHASVDAQIDADAIDVLLKPFGRERFDRVLDHARAYVDQEGASDLRSHHLRLLSTFPEGVDRATRRHGSDSRWSRYIDRILVRDGERIFFLRVDDIDRIEAIGRLTRVHCSGGQTHVLAQSLDSLAPRLDPRQFLSIRRSTVVNLDRLDEPGDRARLAASS